MKPSTIRQFQNLVEAVPAATAWSVVTQLLEHVPGTIFFIKDLHGHYLAANQALVERCGLRRKDDLIGRRVDEVMPGELGRQYALQDRSVLRTGRPVVNRLELHWQPRGRTGWCLTTKLPLRNADGKIIGLIGFSHDLPDLENRSAIPESLTGALNYLERSFDQPLTAAMLARQARLPPPRFARFIKRIFRCTPTQLIAQTRLTVAARLLTDTQQPVATIALACGFSDQSAFSRAFRIATGLTPIQFRQSTISQPTATQRD